jgi:hypothetical protein
VTEFGTALDNLGIAQRRVAEIFGVSARHIRRWRNGTRRVPRPVGIVCNLLAVGVVTVEQVEAAALVFTRTNGGGAEPEPASLHVERAPVPAEAATVKIDGDAGPEAPAPPVEPAPAPAEAAAALTLVKINGASVAPAPEPAETLAEKVCRLTGCRWPNGDPKGPNFFFCNAAVIKPPYCPRHHDAAYMTRSSPEARPEFQLRGLAPPMRKPMVRCPAHAGEKQPAHF